MKNGVKRGVNNAVKNHVKNRVVNHVRNHVECGVNDRIRSDTPLYSDARGLGRTGANGLDARPAFQYPLLATPPDPCRLAAVATLLRDARLRSRPPSPRATPGPSPSWPAPVNQQHTPRW